MQIIRNTHKGCWAFGISNDPDLGGLFIHLAIWHIGFNKKSRARELWDEKK